MGDEGDWGAPGFVAHYNALYGIPEADLGRYLRDLALGPEDSLLDLGCGDGGLLAWAAPQVRRATGVDASEHQVRLARERLKGLANARVVHAQFLEFDAAGEVFTKGFSRKALHHLSDPQKQAFAARLSPSLAPGALILIEDAMYDFPAAQLPDQMPRVLREAAPYFGAEWEAKREDFLHMLRCEFPTGQDFWVAALEAAGFRVQRRWQRNCFLGGVLARKEG